MRSMSWLLPLAVALWVTGAAADSHKRADAPSQSGDKSPYQMDEAAMEAMRKASMPGEGHKRLEFLIGDWKTESTMWMGPEPARSNGAAHCEWAMDGRYVISQHTGTVMDRPFLGMAIDGYDNLEGRYFNVWIDNAGTGYMTSHGQFSPDGKTCTLTGTTMDPATRKPVKHKMVSKITGPDTYTLEMYMTHEGQDQMKVLEVKYTRVTS